MFGITNIDYLIDTAVIRRFSLKYSINAKLRQDEFCDYIEYLSEPIKYKPEPEDLIQLFEIYKDRSLNLGDIKSFYKNLLIDIICEDKENPVRDKLFNLFKEGFSTDEHLTRTNGAFANGR